LLILAILLLTTLASAVDPIRVFTFPDGRIRLWLKGAPTVTATPQGGWTIQPAGKEKDKTWLKRLRAAVGTDDPSPWKSLLDGIQLGSPVSGVYVLQPKASMTIEPAETGTMKVRASDGKGATFKKTAGTWASGEAETFESSLASSLGSTGPAFEAALLRTAGVGDKPVSAAATWSAFLSAVAAGTVKSGPVLLDTASGPAVLDVEVLPLKPPTGVAAPKTADKPTGKAPESGSSWPLIIGALVLGAGAGVAGGYFLATRKAADQARELAHLKQSSAETAAKLKKREDELNRTKKTLDETKRAAHEYQAQQSAWVRDRDDTVRALNEARAAHGQAVTHAQALQGHLRQVQDESQRTARELGQQVESLTRNGQRSQAEMQALAARARAYADLQHEAAEAFNFMQSEIGRTEVAAAVGYLLNYSCGQLLESIAKPNPVLARAMLSNIERIASGFPTLPHARKLVATSQRLQGELGPGNIPESTQAHTHARHFDETLRLLRHQRGLELSPFYFGVDNAGAAHAVYV
jgi:hypothetical protein